MLLCLLQFPSPRPPPPSCNMRANTFPNGHQHLQTATALNSGCSPAARSTCGSAGRPLPHSGTVSPASCWDTTIAEPLVPAEGRWGLEQVTRFTLHAPLPDSGRPTSGCPFPHVPCPFLARGTARWHCPQSPGLSLLVPWHMEAAMSQGATACVRGFPSDTPAFSLARATIAGGFLQRGECFLSAVWGQRGAASLTEVSH